ncbi:MAG: ELM1/GtrOC1 family putative glycosyltransferase [Candidatus Poribacteria bacterium]|nr:ELM1/GtrOC1 family putative glycosyltransferase [Candidatus Poribacteria bacterium]
MKVVILSDNKPGHYKQSLGIVEKMPKCQMEWLEIQFRAKWRDNLLRIFMCIFGGIPLSVSFTQTLLRLSLAAETYNSVLQIRDADIVLSTGSSVAAVNLLFGKILHAKTVTCRRPSPVGIRHFDLAILPMLSWEKAKAKGRDNVCKTIGVPNPISPDILNAERTQLLQKLNLPDSPRIGILVGGTDQHETITIEDAEHLSKICKTVVQKMNAQISVTTSRRTPLDVTEQLKSQLESTDWCLLFIEPDTTSELDDPYQAILALSDILIVTADSFSMVCEAASSERKVIILSLSEKRRRQPKRYKVYEYMEQHSIVSRCTLDGLSQQIDKALASNCNSSTPLRDTEKAADAIRTLIDKK